MTGTGYDPRNGTLKGARGVTTFKSLGTFVEIATHCNDSQVRVDPSGKVLRFGEPTEAACKVVAEKMMPGQGLAEVDTQMKPALGYRRVGTLPFGRKRKSMSVVCAPLNSSSNNILYCKGAPESVLDRCTHVMNPKGNSLKMTRKMRNLIDSKVDEMAGTPLRTLMFRVMFECTNVALSLSLSLSLSTHTHSTQLINRYTCIRNEKSYQRTTLKLLR